MVGILAGAFGGATLARTVAGWLRDAGLSQGYSNAAGVALVVLLITYLSLIVGELVPKRLALQHPETLASLVARPMRILSRIAAPAVALLSVSTDLVLRLLGVRAQAEAPVSEEEIRIMIQQSTEAGVFEAAEEAMVSGIFRLGDRRVGELMTPRPSVVWLDIDDPPEAIWREMADAPHSRFPVCRGGLDDVLGVVAVKDVWAQTMHGEPPDLGALVRPALILPETLPVLRSLDLFKQHGTQLGVVVDEFGGTSGVMTLDDVLEAIVGDISTPDTPADPRVVRRDDGSWLIDGLLSTDELKEVLGLKELPDEDEYQTVAGFVLLQLGRIPHAGDAFDWNRYRFEVVDMDGNRIDKVLVIPRPPTGLDEAGTVAVPHRLGPPPPAEAE
jgi:putative hemolysin